MQGLILDELPCKPGSTAGTPGVAGSPSSFSTRQGLAPTPGPLATFGNARLALLRGMGCGGWGNEEDIAKIRAGSSASGAWLRG